jgi:hypothetical protein
MGSACVIVDMVWFSPDPSHQALAYQNRRFLAPGSRCRPLEACTLLRVEWEHVGRDYRIWFWFAAVCLCLGAVLYLCVNLYVWKMFPDGYIIS